VLTLAFASTSHAAAWSRERAEDFDAMRRAIDASYAYPHEMGAWARAGALRQAAARAADADRFVATLERALELLHDDHVTLSMRSHGSPRWVPAESDIWARFAGGKARIEAVRVASDADVAGLQPGQEVTHVQGIDVARAVDERLGAERNDPRARDWALRHLLAGPRNGRFTLTLAPDGRQVTVQHHAPGRAPVAALARRMGEARDLAYIRLHFGGAPSVARQLDEALSALDGARARIVDLRGNAEIDREDARAVLARFARAPRAWQVRVGRDGMRHEDRIDRIAPGPRVPLVVLVDRWTGGEAEGLALGLRSLAGATLIGTPMAGLRGAASSVRLPHSGIAVRFPAERALTAEGAPREDALPDLLVDLAAASGGPGDPILYQALKKLER